MLALAACSSSKTSASDLGSITRDLGPPTIGPDDGGILVLPDASGPDGTGGNDVGGTGFHVANGQIIGLDGNAFIAKGINIYTTVSVDELTAVFPGINFVRLPIPGAPNGYASAADLASRVNALTAAHIVVEIEDHPWPQLDPLTGSDLTSETSWYGDLASTFVDNPYVWFGTMNEPQSGTGMQDQVGAIYKAIRGAGNDTIIMMEAGVGGGNPGTVGDGGGYGAGQGYTASYFTGLSNVVWDFHFYAWLANASADQPTVTAALMGSATSHSGVVATTTITSADGAIPVIIGEYGIACCSTGTQGGQQVITAVESSGFGSSAWAWYPAASQAGDADLIFNDDLTDGNGGLSSYGQTVAAYIAK